MKKTVIALSATISTIILSSGVEARTALSARERCFQIGQPVPGGWNEVLKIKPQQALTDKPGALVETIGLVHGAKTPHPPLNYYNQFAGAASYIPPGDQEVDNVVQIALVGTSYGTDTGTPEGIYGLWTLGYSLILEPEKKGKIPGGQIVGEKRFKPIGNGHDADPPKETLVDAPVAEISCSSF